MAPIPYLHWFDPRGIRRQRLYELDFANNLPRCLYAMPNISIKFLADGFAVIWSIGGFVIVSITALACASPDYNSA